MRRTLLLLALLLAGCNAGQQPTSQQPTATMAQAAYPSPAPQAAYPTPPGAVQPPQQLPPELLDVAPDDPRAIGDLAAPVTIIEFSDFECPFCRRFALETEPALVKTYVEQGQVRFIYRDLPGDSHRSAVPAAQAARCAAAQGQFWPMHDWLFATHGEEWGDLPMRDRTVFADQAERMGLDRATFQSCMRDPIIEQAIIHEGQLARQAGMTATPTFIINGQLITGLITTEQLNLLIDQYAP